MATITQAVTLDKQVRGDVTRYVFRYALDNGEIHERRALVPSSASETTERTERGNMLLNELAAGEIEQGLS